MKLNYFDDQGPVCFTPRISLTGNITWTEIVFTWMIDIHIFYFKKKQFVMQLTYIYLLKW